jgi:hypothetical protein
MELARSTEANSELGRAILPALNGIEGHLAQVEAIGRILPCLACLTGRLDPI